MIQIGDLVKHKHLGGLGLVKRVAKTSYTVIEDAHQATIQWLINPYDGGGYAVIWTKHLELLEIK